MSAVYAATIDKGRMIEVLHGIDKTADESWLKTLSERKIEESIFHDNSHQIQGRGQNSKFYSIAGASDEYLYDWIAKKSPGKLILDYACGNGGCAVRAAQAGVPSPLRPPSR
jgi:hypothetical protein